MMVEDKVETVGEKFLIEKVERLERELAEVEREAHDLDEELESERAIAEGREREGSERAVREAAEILADVERGVFTLPEAKVQIEDLA